MDSWDVMKEAIQRHMKAEGVSINGLRTKTGMAPATIYGLFNETANPGVEQVAKLLRALGKSWAWLEEECNGKPKKNGKPTPAPKVAPSQAVLDSLKTIKHNVDRLEKELSLKT